MNNTINGNLIYTFMEYLKMPEQISLLDNFINSDIYDDIISNVHEHTIYRKNFIDMCANIINYICSRYEIDKIVSEMIKIIIAIEDNESIERKYEMIRIYISHFHKMKIIEENIKIIKFTIDSMTSSHKDDNIKTKILSYIDNSTSELLQYDSDISKDFYSVLVSFYANRTKYTNPKDIIHFMDNNRNLYLHINNRYLMSKEDKVIDITKEYFDEMCKKASHVYLTIDDEIDIRERTTLLYYFIMNRGMITIDIIKLMYPIGIYNNSNDMLLYGESFDIEIVSKKIDMTTMMLPNVHNNEKKYISIGTNDIDEIFQFSQIKNALNICEGNISWYIGNNLYGTGSCNVLIGKHELVDIYIVIYPVDIEIQDERILFLSYPIYKHENIIIAATESADYYITPNGKLIKSDSNNRRILNKGKNKIDDEIVGIYMIDDGLLEDEKWMNAFLLLYGDTNIPFTPKQIRNEMKRLNIKYDDGIIDYGNICMIANTLKFKKNKRMHRFYIDFIHKNEDNTCTLIYEICNTKLVFDYTIIKSVNTFLDEPDWYISDEYIVAQSNEYNIQIILRPIR